MKKGLESFRDAVMKDAKDYNDCFNENGCDHEFTRLVPEERPGLIEMGFTQKCIMVSKCSHKYCDKYAWTIERAKYYAEKTGKTYEEVLEIWEENRTYWYMNYYQDCNQPLRGRSRNDERYVKTLERIEVLKKEIETWDFIAEGLTYEHQLSAKNEILTKVKNMTIELNEAQARIKLHDISCFDLTPACTQNK